MFEKFDVVEVNNKNFIVLNIIDHNNNLYLYLINEDENNDEYSIVKVINQNDKIFFDGVSDEEYQIITNKLVLENKEEMKEILSSYEEN
ncbi:MAG: hypothetical protein IJB83_03920 [Bacilli bacterium]|nr:hypothetical protein [Bacilli bacterium]